MGKEIKEYGTDLLKQYKELAEKQKILRNKAIKRLSYLLDNSKSTYLEGFTKDKLDNLSTDTMLFVITRVEEEYVKQSKQLNLFK